MNRDIYAIICVVKKIMWNFINGNKDIYTFVPVNGDTANKRSESTQCMIKKFDRRKERMDIREHFKQCLC